MEWLYKTVRLEEDYIDIKKGTIGKCTADLSDDNIFAVMFIDKWITFREKNIREKFTIIEEVK